MSSAIDALLDLRNYVQTDILAFESTELASHQATASVLKDVLDQIDKKLAELTKK